jgi:hypothetical protein
MLLRPKYLKQLPPQRRLEHQPKPGLWLRLTQRTTSLTQTFGEKTFQAWVLLKADFCYCRKLGFTELRQITGLVKFCDSYWRMRLEYTYAQCSVHLAWLNPACITLVCKQTWRLIVWRAKSESNCAPDHKAKVAIQERMQRFKWPYGNLLCCTQFWGYPSSHYAAETIELKKRCIVHQLWKQVNLFFAFFSEFIPYYSRSD